MFCGDLERPGFDLAVGIKRKQVIPPNAAMYWSCFPTGSFKMIHLDLASLFGDLAGVDRMLLMNVKCFQESRGEAPGRPHPGSGRDVGHAVDLESKVPSTRAASEAPRGSADA